MVENNDDQKLKALDARLKAARGVEESEVEEAQPSALGVAWKLGMELVVGVCVGAFIGYWIDIWFGSNPVGLLVMIFLGFGAGVRNVYREAEKLQREADES